MRAKLFSFIICLFSLLNGSAIHAGDTIQWQNIHFPPLTILRGADKGQGQLDQFLPYLQKRLPQYQHQNVEMNWARTFRMIGNGEYSCSTMVFKTPERESVAQFSVPVAVASAIRIIMSKENISLLGNPKTYPLAKLVRDKRFYGSLVNDRSYTPTIDKLLAQYKSEINLDRKAITIKSLLAMLKLDRVNYLVEYSPTVAYLMKNDTDFQQRFSSIAIEEVPLSAVIYLACPRNAWGEKVVERINNVVVENHDSDAYIDLITRYYNPAEKQAAREDLRSAISLTTKAR